MGKTKELQRNGEIKWITEEINLAIYKMTAYDIKY